MYRERVTTVIGLVHSRKLFSKGQVLSALFVIGVSTEGQSLCFQKINTKNWKLICSILFAHMIITFPYARHVHKSK